MRDIIQLVLVAGLFSSVCLYALELKWKNDEINKKLASICGEVQKLDLLVVDKEGVCG